MLSDERYKALLRGDKPINKDEEIWLENFNKRIDKVLEKDRIEEEIYLKNKTNAYHEYYKLLISVLPKDFLSKKPIADEEAESIYSGIVDKAYEEVQKIISNPILRKLNGFPLERSSFSDGEKIYIDKFVNNFIYKKYKEKYKLDIKSVEEKYYSYMNNKIVTIVQEIEKKYDVVIDCSFYISDYFSNWERFNV